jgi:branched-chain amino acid transport system substrate-binding protein
MPHMRRSRARATARRALAAATAATLLAACGVSIPGLQSTQPAAPQQPAAALGSGQVRVGLILPLSAAGNAGLAAQSMRNAAELALAEFNAPNIRLLVKDDGGNPSGAQTAAQEALNEGAEIILGPLFGPTVAPAGQVARGRNVPMIAFSTDTSVASRGVFLLSFLPETDVDRVVDFAASRGKRSFTALIPDNAYGNVVDAAFREAVARTGGRIVAAERYPADRALLPDAVRRIVPALPQADALFLPGDADLVSAAAQALATNAVDFKRLQLLGTGLWDDQRVYHDSSLQGGWFAAPDTAGYRGFSARYRAKYGQDPARTATLAYDAVSLAAALVKTQGPQRFSEQVLTNASGFSGVEGIFRFRSEGTNDRGLSVVRVTPSGPQVVSPAPKSFTEQGT